ncbi:hypothetical protein [Streptomyces sp. NBC_01803]|uniref:hypothetical protein n=1 Tax=Streptomyces sp. NBC_01803 TaxID=2975946 RepID=UPI002DD86550|nr:hypothetical protein [Streptomyces sp. NBC_01803]WSA45527.1 hypothetical protein OIE51_15770 [Streptomyces sp. NBC_01803]
MGNKRGDPHRALAALRALERTAPEEVRHPSPHILTTAPPHSPQHLPDIREFTTRTGALTV